MKIGFLKASLLVSIVAVSTAVGVTLLRRSGSEDEGGGRGGREARAIPVEVTEIRRGAMEQRRRFSGTLTPSAQLSVAPKISGRISAIHYDLSDPVERGAVVATLDDAEFTQALSSTRADLRVAEAQASEAANRLEPAERELTRVRTLEKRGVASEAALDNAQTEYLMRQSAYQVTEANLDTRRAAVSTAEIRLSYTQITATWSEGDESRVVSERLKDDGDTVAANTPLLTVVRLRPIRAVFFVPERDYGRFESGQAVEIRTDAYPGIIFPGRVSRVAPVFQEDSRQARVEVLSDNEDERLKPGMFIRAEVVFQTLEDAIAVPLEALTRRGGESGVFLVNEGGESVTWVKVETGVESGGRVQILEPEIEGLVVTLGQQLLGDGSKIQIIDIGEES